MIRLSMTKTLKDAQHSFLRFPLVFLCAVLAAGSAIALVGGSSDKELTVRILLATTLGIPLLLSFALACENRQWSQVRQILVQISGVLLLGAYFLTLGDPLPGSHVIRFFLLLAGSHFLVSFAPFIWLNPGQALWQFNKTILMRLLASLIFSIIMFAGLSLAIAALDNLLGVSWPHDIYLKLFMLLAFVFNTWFFLGGVPSNPQKLADDTDFPRPLQIFAQYILSTLVGVYLGILLAYLAKILLSGIWPSGWVGWLVSSVAVAGLVSVLLLSPLQSGRGNRWVNIYFKFFHILMLPASIMLIMAASKRVNQYGLTEPRYILLALSIWTILAMVLGILSKRIATRTIPLSLCCLALLISFGPWGAASLSEKSQKSRLANELASVNLFSNGQLQPALTDSVNINHRQITQSFRYLLEQFGYNSLDSWLSPELRDSLNELKNNGDFEYNTSRSRADLIVSELGVLHYSQPHRSQCRSHHLENDGLTHAFAIDSFDYALSLDFHTSGSKKFSWGGVTGQITMPKPGDRLVLEKEGVVLMEMPLSELFMELANMETSIGRNNQVTPKGMTFNHSNDRLQVRLVLDRLIFANKPGPPKVRNMTGLLLLGPCQPEEK